MKLAWILAPAALAAGGCGNPSSPTLCVGGPGADINMLMACPTTTPEFLPVDGEPVYVVSRLPNGIDPGDQAVLIQVSTACATVSQTVSYSNQVAFAVFAAPAGADCSTTVTATIENSTIRVVSLIDASACVGAPACPVEASAPLETVPSDAGTD